MSDAIKSLQVSQETGTEKKNKLYMSDAIKSLQVSQATGTEKKRTLHV